MPFDIQDAISRGQSGKEKFHSLALMDGGIYDNQGIDSLLLADDRKDTKRLDLFIISDVDPAQNNLFPYPQNNKPSSNLTLGQVDWMIRLFLFVCVLTMMSISYGLWQEIQQRTFIFWKDFFSALMPLVLVAGVVFSLWWGRKVIKKQILPRIPKVGLVGWQDLKTLTVDEFFYLLELRITSLLALTGSVFMDRIKALNLAQVYENKAYEGKRISNRIDRLIDPKRKVNLPGITPLRSMLKEVIERATEMPTTLWFDNSQQLVDVTIAGQATICFNLMQYIVRQYGEDSEIYPLAIKEMWDKLKQDWEILNENPNSLLQELFPQEKFPQP
ncbi:MAG: hypothetical protein HC936_04415 [Leptolyngbyaceae cyanobacterium SU_3_3]|nr:hypothetical protein [Leptolyngbyaceae cyanobacterium SU_3_3]